MVIWPERLTLERGADSIRLEPRVMALLVDLAETAPGTVAREQLLERHWPAHVTDDALHRAIWKLRRSLRQLGVEDEIVETVPKLGYRLRVEMRNGAKSVEPTPETETTPEAEAALSPTGEGIAGLDHRRLVGVAAMLLVLLAALAVATRGPRTGQPTRSVRLPGVPLVLDAEGAVPRTTLPGYESSPALLADGTLVFAHYTKEGPRALQWDLFALAPDGATTRRSDDPVPPPRAEPIHQLGPVADPTGRWLAYLRVVGSDCQIVLRGPTGDRDLLSCGTGPAQAAERWPELAWGPEGELYFSDRRGAGEPRRIWRLDPLRDGSAEGAPAATTPLQVTHPARDAYGDTWPAPSPDGRLLAFVRASSPGLDDLWLRDLGSGAERQLTFDGANLGGCAWNAEGSALLVSSRRSGSFRLWALDPDTATLTPLAAPGRHLSGPRRIPGGFLVEEWQSRINLWRLDLEGQGVAVGEPSITSTRWSLMPALSPSGDRLAFVSDRDGAMEIWLADGGRDGPLERRQTDLDLEAIPRLAWSPAGDALVFSLPVQGSFDLHRLELATGQLDRLTHDASNERNPFYSPDGRYLFFASDRRDGWQLWSLELANGTVAPRTTDGGFAAQGSLDGVWLYLVRHDAPGIWRRPMAAGPERPSEPWVSDFPAGDALAWTVVDHGVAYLRRHATASGATELWVRDQAGDRRLAVLEGPDGPLAELWTDSSLVVSPDLTQLVIASLDHSASDLWFLPVEPGLDAAH